MCGIAGFLNKTSGPLPVGRLLLQMLNALSCRGPDSAGVAVWRPQRESWLLRVKLGEPERIFNGAQSKRARAVLEATETIVAVQDIEVTGAYARIKTDGDVEADAVIAIIEAVDPDVEVVSMGHALEIVKQVGTPEQLEADFRVSKMNGTHGIAHTRLSTESRIDLSHSQPFWAHHLPDVATVHNGHITNYHKLRRIYEQRGIRFYTENDSEIIGIYLRERMMQGDSFEEALHATQRDFDGSYCFLAANSTTLAYVKDGFGFKPLVVAENDEMVAIATEEIALDAVIGNEVETREPPAHGIHLWSVTQPTLV